uniref:Uncharacterized protein n=1 Tax=Romanomermis culicivorax TaxID=13658 RepID=A0A915LB05_ROMCU
MSTPLGKTLRTPPRPLEPSGSNFDLAEEHAAVGQIQPQVSETEQRQECKTAEMSKLQEELARISFEMAKQAKTKATVAKNVKGQQMIHRQRPTMPLRIVHQMDKTLDEIRRKSRLAWKSNLTDMNMDDYYKDAPTELMEDMSQISRIGHNGRIKRKRST